MRDVLEARDRGRGPGPVPGHGRRPCGAAHPHTTRGVDGGGVPCLRPRAPRTRGACRHDQLLRSRARSVGERAGEIPGRRSYPGYLYSDLASIYERCGRMRGRTGSVTLVPVLTMPAGDVTHPVPDLTGYITEGQIVLSPDVHGLGVYPPIDVLGSLSRLMRKGTGEGHTRADHPAIAAQLVAALAYARQARDLAELIGAAALTETDRRYLAFADAFNIGLLDQRADEAHAQGHVDPCLALRLSAAQTGVDDGLGCRRRHLLHRRGVRVGCRRGVAYRWLVARASTRRHWGATSPKESGARDG